EQKLALCEYDCRGKSVARAGSPDGRLWAAGSYQGELTPVPGTKKKVTPGPIADAGACGTKLLTAFTIPHADARRVAEASQKGIVLRPDEPLRIEVVGRASTAAKQILADTAAEELAKRGKAVDSSAAVGVRIEVPAAKRETWQKSRTVVYMGRVPPQERMDVYYIDVRIHLVNSKIGVVGKTTIGQDGYIAVTESDWETTLCKGIGKAIGMRVIPLTGRYDSDGKDTALSPPPHLGIDGVLELNERN